MTPLNAQPQHQSVVDYLDYFGLHDDPFSSDQQAFYDGGSRRELFSELLHLCQFSASLLVVVGEEGVGKAGLKSELCEHFAEQDKVLHFSVPVLCSEELLLSSLASQLGIDVDGEDFNAGNISESIVALREFVHDSEDDDSLKVVMIENAHNLDDASLKVLMRLSAPGDQNPYRQLHTLLFAEPVFEQRIEKLDQQALVQTFQLLPLTPAEIKHYLRFRLDQAGFSGIFPFKDPDVQFLWDISKGIPGKFHDAAREILIELALPPPETKSLGMPVTHMAAVVFLLAGLLMVFFYQSGSDEESSVLGNEALQTDVTATETNTVSASADIVLLDENADQSNKENAADSDKPLETPASESEAPGGGALVAATTDQKVPAAQALLPNPKPAELTSKPQDAEAAQNVKPVVKPLSVPAPKDRPKSVAASNQAKPNETKPDETRASQPANEAAVDDEIVNDEIKALIAAAKQELETEPLTPKPSQSASSGGLDQAGLTADESSLLNKAPDNFTLQVLAGASRQAVDDFIRRQPNRQDLAVFTADRDGKTLYIVVMGSFPSSNAARSAVDSLPQEQKKAGPWPRSLQSVQAEIRQFRGF